MLRVRVKMDLESMFLSHFSIGKKPDIFELIGAAIQVGAWKHREEFNKHKDRILKLLMNPENLDDAVEEDEVIDSDLDEIEDDKVIDGCVTGIEEDEVMDSGAAEIEEAEVVDNGVTQIEELVEIEELVQEKSCRFGEHQEIRHLVSEKENKTEEGKCRINTSAMGLAATNKISKRSQEKSNVKRVQETQLVADCSTHKRLEEGEQLEKRSNCSALKGLKPTTKEKQSHKLGFKKMETDSVQHNQVGREKKTKEGARQMSIRRSINNTTDNNVGSVTKLCSTLGSKKRSQMTKMNVAVKRVEVAPPHDILLLSDCSQQKKLEEGNQIKKQNNFNDAITGLLRKNPEESIGNLKESKPGDSIGNLKGSYAAKLESSKRKFGERVEELNKAKRRIIMVDFHDMPKPSKDPPAPKRCWDRRRF